MDQLRCDGFIAPLNVDAEKPVLSWIYGSDVRGDKPTAYQVFVATTPEILDTDQPDLWDSGKVASADVNCAYGGVTLTSGQACYWKIRVWDAKDQVSDWSASSQWTMGLPAPDDWKAKWITQPASPTTRPMPVFRKQFSVDKPVHRAVIWISGLGQFDLSVNGHRATEDILQPGWTNYRKTVLYCGYDVTSLLKQGDNALSVMLGNGMYTVPEDRGRYHKFVGTFGPPELIAQLRVDYADGSSDTIGTDSSWQTASGPITFSSIYGGEDYDARLGTPSEWSAAVETSGPGGTLFGSTHSAPPVRVAKILDAVSVSAPRPGVTVYDLGQNCAEMPVVTVGGQAGDSVRLTPGEVLGADGLVNQSPSGRGCLYTYTLNGSGEQTWSPRFCYYGSRYIQVEGTAKIVKLQGQFITSSASEIGEFSCSNDLFNRTNNLIRWAMRSNMVSLLTDCPHREKLGWLEQDHLVGPSLMYNFDVQTLLRKIGGDMADAQHADGLVPDIAPEYTVFKNGFLDSPEWGSASVLIPWNVYCWYGDKSALESHYDMMRKYVAYLATKADNGIISYGLGDWYDLGPKPPGVAQLTSLALTATAFYYRDLEILFQTAHVLGHKEDASGYAEQVVTEHEAFNQRFYNAAEHRYDTGSQTANALALALGMPHQVDRAGVLADLVGDIRKRNNGLTAGDIGYRYVLRALADGGRSAVIFDMNNQSDRPGYGWQLAHGATSLTEAWDASQRASQDHFMLGHIMEWFYSDLAGIQNAEGSIGFEHVVIKPTPVGDVSWAKASVGTVRGRVECSWRLEGNKFTLDVTIPPGADAVVHMPFHSGGENPDIQVQSGKYSFSATKN